MKITKGLTENFDLYKVTKPRLWWQFYKPSTIEIQNVIEANEETGLVVVQLTDEQGSPLYDNGEDTLAIDNTARLLLLLPPIQKAFLEAGFVPKTISTYEKDMRIVNKNPTVAIAVNVEQAMEAEG